MAFSSGNSGGPMADINVTPLVDVMLVLLIIFIVTAPIMTYPIDVALPQRVINPPPVTKEPPPASAFCSPAHRPAAKIRRSISIGVASGGRAGDHDTNAPRAAGAR